MSDSYDDHIRSGLALGDDHWCHLEYRLPNGDCVGLPAGATIPEGAVLIGVNEHHRSRKPDKAGEWCGGYLHFKNVPEALLADERYGTESRHELVQAHPLTIAPSIGCRQCPNHGWIRAGRWSLT